jgi:two-component system, cell cycle sensor histidine kinase and response regulator CckA
MSAPSPARAPRRGASSVGALPLALIAIPVAMGLWFVAFDLPRQRAETFRHAATELGDRASIRRLAIEAWVADELSDARTLVGLWEAPAAGRAGGSAAAATPEQRRALATLARIQGVREAAVLDSALDHVVGSTPGFALRPEVRALARAARAARIDTVEFVLDAAGAPQVAFVAARGSADCVGVLLEDPRDWLYPMLTIRPHPVPSADALLIRLDGDSVLLLSPRARAPGSAMRERVPIDLGDRLTQAAIAGRPVAGHFLDRSGPVFAAVQPVARTGWSLVVKAEDRDVLASFRQRAYELGLGLGLIALSLIALASALTWGRRRAREAERAMEHARITELFEHADDPVLFIGEDGRIRGATRRAEEFYGVSANGLIGQHAVNTLRVPEDRASGEQQYRRVLTEGRAVFETNHLAAGGRTVAVEISSRLVEVEGERLVVSVVRDITARRRADEQLRKLSRAVESNPAGIVITDTQGLIEYVNPGYVAITGYAADELLGREPSVLKSGETLDDTYRELWRTISSGQDWRGELLNRRKDGSTYWAELSISPLRDDLGRISHYVGIQEDVTERKRGQEVLRTTQMQLLQAQKMETVGRLAGGVAHDFNNLLTIIHGYGELLLLPLAPGSDDRAKVEEILKAAGRAAQLTRQLLAFSRRQVLEPRVLDLRVAIDDAERMLRRVIGEDIGFEVHRPAALGRVKADPGQIEQVLLNLVVNARDAMPEGGRLTLTLDDVELGASVAGVGEPVTPGRYVVLVVSDTGHGMQPEVRSHLFEPFFTTKEVGKGTGLGLATVYGIVKQSGGYVGVETQPDAGTTFRVYLPQVDEPLPAAPPSLPTEGMPGHGERVLLVEDDDAVRGLAWALLAERGFHVTAASDGETALALAERETKAFDLLVTDVVMPGQSGIELARRLRERWPELPVLLVSGYSDDATARAGALGAGVRFLQKPFSAHTLAEAVREALTGV